MSETTIHYEDAADRSVLDGRTVAVVGYGNQGRSQALNLRDGGVDVVVGNRDDEYRERAAEDGFDPVGIEEAAAAGDVVFLLVPDEVAPEVYEERVEPHLEAGDTLHFASGYNVTYDLIRPPEDVDVTMVAPRMPGPAVRALVEAGEAFPSIVAVDQDHTGEAFETALALADAIGSTPAGVIEGTFDMETKTDLMAEQALFPVWVAAMMAKYEVEVAHGIPPEIVLTELYLSYEMSEIFGDMAEYGYLGQLEYHSTTSQYGQLSRLDEFDRSGIREFMEEQLRGIDNGSFAREWSAERDLDRVGLKRLYRRFESTEFFEDERETMAKLDFEPPR